MAGDGWRVTGDGGAGLGSGPKKGGKKTGNLNREICEIREEGTRRLTDKNPRGGSFNWQCNALDWKYLGRFYERLLYPTRDSLAPARSALRAFAAAANS